MRARQGVLAAALAVAPLAACGGDSDVGAGGAPVVNWYIGNESWLPDVIEACNAQADGAYVLQAESLPTNPDAQREQLVRRLAATDSAIDLIGMDVVWTAEFGQAGWIRPFEEGELANVGRVDDVLQGPFESSIYAGTQYGAPLNSNTRLLWYRESELGDRPVPETWDELLDTADALGTNIQQTGRRAESLMVFFNALVESAGTSIIETDDSGETSLVLEQEPTVEALRIMGRYADSAVAPPALSTSGEDDNRLAFQSQDSDAAFMINWPYVYPSVLEADEELAADYGVAPYPRVDPSQPAAAPLGGYNLGISSYSDDQEAALAAINCLTEPAQQRTIATIGGQPSVLRELAEDPEIMEVLPFLPLMTEQLENAAPRPVSPSYNDLSLAVRQVLHPMRDIDDPEATYRDLRDLLERALNSQAVL